MAGGPPVTTSGLPPSRRFVRLGSLHWNAASPRRAVRIALGVTLPLAAGWWAGRADLGAYAALGALPAGLVAFEGQARSRAAGVLLASLGMAVATFVGATMAAVAPGLLPLVTALWAYATGLLICLGAVTGLAALQWTTALLIAIGLPFGPGDAALRALLVFAGGALQAGLVAASWALRPGATERAALAASYATLASYASRLASGFSRTPAPGALPAQAVLEDPNPLLDGATCMQLLNLLEEAERVQATLACLGAELGEARAPDGRRQLGQAAGVLAHVSRALAAGRRERASLAEALHAQLERWVVPADASWRWSGEELTGQLRAIARMLGALDDPPPGTRPQPGGEGRWAQWRASAATAATTLRANITGRTEAGRHALRLAAVCGVAEVLAQATDLAEGRWVALTALVVLKPDHGSTYERSVHRALGTACGALLGVAIAHFAGPGQGGLVVACALSAALAYALFRVNYLLYSIPLTVFIVVLLALLGTPAAANAEARTVDTCIGSALALCAYLVWPTWKGATAQQEFAALVATTATYITELLLACAHPGRVAPARLRALQRSARRAASNAEAAAARLQVEPPEPRLTPGFARLLLATVARLKGDALALHALALSPARDPAPGHAATERLASALHAALRAAATALRALEAPPQGPDLRSLYVEVAAASGRPDRTFVDLADSLVDATESMQDLLRRRLPAPSSTR